VSPVAAQAAGPAEGRGEKPVTVIVPTRGLSLRRLAEAWPYRELAYFLVWRDVKVRYKQTALGGAWAVLQPALLMIVFTVVLQQVAHLSSEGKPYALFSYAALVPWTLFTSGLQGASDSLVANAALVSKTYFPRILLPLAAAAAPLVDFGIAFGLLAVLMVGYGQAPTWAVVLLPALIVYTLLAALAIGLWLSALNVRYRDFRYTVPFMIQLGLFITPVAYASRSLPDAAQVIVSLNPMTAVVEGFRWALLGTTPPSALTVALSAGATTLLLIGGLAYFQKVERTFADVI
jgi:lipopolysaccharide transport system permease protein